MLVDGGVFEGRRLLGAGTLQMMFTDQLQEGRQGFRFGLGFGIEEVTLGGGTTRRRATEFTWSGYAGTEFRIIPSERLIQIVLRQEVPFDDSLAKELAASVHSRWPPRTTTDSAGTSPP